MAVAAAQVIEADVCDDAINPSIESAFEAEAVEIAVNLEKGFLVDIPRIFRAAQHIEREPQNLAIVALHEHLESGAVTRLRALDQRSVIGCRKLGRGKHR